MSYYPKGKGIFCLEGDWWGIRDTTTVETMLQFIQKSGRVPIPYIHRDIGTFFEFRYYLWKWTQQAQKDHPILYLAFHGIPGGVYVGDKRKSDSLVSLETMGELLKGKCRRRIIVIGSCETLAVSPARIHKFLKTTRAAAVCGYRKEVEWVTSAALEIILLSTMQQNEFTIAGAKSIKNRMKKMVPSLISELQFSMIVRKD